MIDTHSHNGNGIMNQEVIVDHDYSEENEDQKYEADFRALNNRSMNDEEKQKWKREKD
jgi:hypothetical protein